MLIRRFFLHSSSCFMQKTQGKVSHLEVPWELQNENSENCSFSLTHSTRWLLRKIRNQEFSWFALHIALRLRNGLNIRIVILMNKSSVKKTQSSIGMAHDQWIKILSCLCFSFWPSLFLIYIFQGQLFPFFSILKLCLSAWTPIFVCLFVNLFTMSAI